MTILRQPTRAGVRDAAAKVAAILPPTPLIVAPVRGVPVMFKAESLQPIGAFKIRGAWHRLTAIDPEQRGKGVVAFSSGNHAQGVAWAAKRLGMPAVIVMPSDAPAAKREATLALGAEVVAYDRMRENRVKIAGHLAHARGATLVPPFDDPWIIEGQGSLAIEVLTQCAELKLPDPRYAVVPCGGGGLAAGVTLALPDAQVTIVEPEGWDDVTRSLAVGWIESIGDDPPPTACDSLQTFAPAQLTFDVLSRHGVTGVTVTEAQVRAAQRWAARTLRLVIEPGGSVALAALLAGKLEPTPDTLVVLSGGNADPDAYARVLGSQD